MTPNEVLKNVKINAFTPEEVKRAIIQDEPVQKALADILDMKRKIEYTGKKLEKQKSKVEEVESLLNDKLILYELGEVDKKETDKIKNDLDKESNLYTELLRESMSREKALNVLENRLPGEVLKAQQIEQKKIQDNIDSILKSFSVEDALNNIKKLMQLKLRKFQCDISRESADHYEDIFRWDYDNAIEIVKLLWEGEWDSDKLEKYRLLQARMR